MHFLLDQRARRLEPERDERLQEHGPQIPGPQRRSDVWAHCFHLAFLGDPQYVGHGAASLPVVGWFSSQELHSPRWVLLLGFRNFH